MPSRPDQISTDPIIVLQSAAPAALLVALLGMGAFAFVHVLINPSSGYLSDTSRTPLLAVLALLGGFAVVSVAFWVWFRLRIVSEQAGGSR